MSTENIISQLNSALETDSLDFRIKPLGDGSKYFWLHSIDNKWAIKITVAFAIMLAEPAAYTGFVRDELIDVFINLPAMAKSPFVYFDRMGFVLIA